METFISQGLYIDIDLWFLFKVSWNSFNQLTEVPTGRIMIGISQQNIPILVKNVNLSCQVCQFASLSLSTDNWPNCRELQVTSKLFCSFSTLKDLLSWTVEIFSKNRVKNIFVFQFTNWQLGNFYCQILWLRWHLFTQTDFKQLKFDIRYWNTRWCKL